MHIEFDFKPRWQSIISIRQVRQQMSMRQDNSRKVVKFVKQEKTFKQVIADERKQLQGSDQRSTTARKHTPRKSPSLSSSPTTTAKPKTLIAQIQRYLQNAKSSKHRIFKGLQFVKLIDNFNQQQRCLQHNHVITLYCLNDKRLLCVYCIYGQNRHRAHKLLPPLQHIEYVAQDVTGLQNSFNSFLYSLEEILTQSKQSTEMFKGIMNNYLKKLETEYIKRKLQLQQMYEKQQMYIVQTCEEFIAKSESIYHEFEDIKFNIWESQARYSLDKRVRLSNVNMVVDTQMEDNKTNLKPSNPKQDTKNTTKSPSKVRTKPSNDDKLQPQKHQLCTDSEKDLREIMCKHVILSHIVQQMRYIDPLRIDQKTVQKKMFNKLQLKLLNHLSQTSHNINSHANKRTTSPIK